MEWQEQALMKDYYRRECLLLDGMGASNHHNPSRFDGAWLSCITFDLVPDGTGKFNGMRPAQETLLPAYVVSDIPRDTYLT